jgi:hypothetical protein
MQCVDYSSKFFGKTGAQVRQIRHVLARGRGAAMTGIVRVVCIGFALFAGGAEAPGVHADRRVTRVPAGLHLRVLARFAPNARLISRGGRRVRLVQCDRWEFSTMVAPLRTLSAQ